MHHTRAFVPLAVWLLLTAVLVQAQVTSVQAAVSTDVPVRRIEVVGTRTADAETVQSSLAFKVGDRLTADSTDQSVKRLFATGRFSDVRIRGDQAGNVTVEVTENPRVMKLSFEGNSALDTAKLTAVIALKRGEVYTRARARADELKIRDLYRHEGRYRTTVGVVAVQDAQGSVDLTFKIAEGEVNKVESIEFSGNRAFTAGQLRDVITTTQSSWLDIVKTNLTFDKERLELDRFLLREHYQKHGYPDAAVAEPMVEPIAATGGFRIAFEIDEGERFTLGPQRIESRLDGIDAGRLSARIVARPGAAYDKSKVDASVTAIGEELAIAGKPFARVVPKSERDGAARSVAVAYAIEDGPHLYIRRIEIGGNSRTRDSVIRRELKLAEGDPYNAAQAETAKKRVQRTGFFKTVEIKPEKTPEADKVDLKVAVTEQDTGELSFGIGYSQNDGIIGDIGFSNRNVFGTGLTAKVKLEAGQRRYGAELGFTDPHFLDSDVAAGFDLFYRDTDRTLQSSYKEQRWGGTVRLAMPITDTLTTGLNYTFTRSTLYDVGANASTAIKEAAGFPNATSNAYNTSSVGYSTAFDTRDSKKLPTSGVYAVVKQDFAGLGGDAQFVRSSADVRAFTPVVDGIVLSGHMGGGTIYGYGGQDVRLLDLFYRGSETVRGFAAAGIGPRDSASANQDALGGKTFYVASTELRAPIPFVPSELGLSAVGFVDAGSLFGTTKTAAALPGLTGNSSAPRISTGAGLVWDSPVGPLQATYGFVLAKQPGDKTQPFNFGLGSGF